MFASLTDNGKTAFPAVPSWFLLPCDSDSCLLVEIREYDLRFQSSCDYLSVATESKLPIGAGLRRCGVVLDSRYRLYIAIC